MGQYNQDEPDALHRHREDYSKRIRAQALKEGWNYDTDTFETRPWPLEPKTMWRSTDGPGRKSNRSSRKPAGCASGTRNRGLTGGWFHCAIQVLENAMPPQQHSLPTSSCLQRKKHQVIDTHRVPHGYS